MTTQSLITDGELTRFIKENSTGSTWIMKSRRRAKGVFHTLPKVCEWNLDSYPAEVELALGAKGTRGEQSREDFFERVFKEMLSEGYFAFESGD